MTVTTEGNRRDDRPFIRPQKDRSWDRNDPRDFTAMRIMSQKFSTLLCLFSVVMRLFCGPGTPFSGYACSLHMQPLACFCSLFDGRGADLYPLQDAMLSSGHACCTSDGTTSFLARRLGSRVSLLAQRRAGARASKSTKLLDGCWTAQYVLLLLALQLYKHFLCGC